MDHLGSIWGLVGGEGAAGRGAPRLPAAAAAGVAAPTRWAARGGLVSGRRASVGAREGARAVLGCARALEGQVDDYGVPGGAARRARAGRVTAGGRICSRGGPLSPRRGKGRSYSSVRRRAPVGVLTQGTALLA
jgi:hypothetical protein